VTKRVRMSAQERREQLVGVGRAVFAERGYEASSVEEIAERAGVSKPVVYQHFGGKEGLYAVVVDREVRRLSDSITRCFDAVTPRLVAIGAADAFLTYIEEHEEGFRVLVRDAPTPLTGGSFATVLADVAQRCERLLVDEFGDRGFDEATAPMYARMMVGAVALVGEWWLDVRKPAPGGRRRTRRQPAVERALPPRAGGRQAAQEGAQAPRRRAGRRPTVPATADT
jgi:AcrR family transcriptional regulator